MFFIISKLLAFLFTPFTWIVILLLYAFFAKEEKKRRKCLKWAIIFVLFFSNGFIFNLVMHVWEVPAKPYSELKVYDAGIVLGGMSVNDPELGRVQFFRGVDRLIQTVDLYKRGIIKKIIFTGGSGRILHPEMKEGMLVKPYILMMGVPDSALIVENESNNTHENALFTRKILLDQKITGNYLLITSASHMRRGLACFKTVGITAEPYSTDRYSGPIKFEFDNIFIPDVSTLYDWSNLFHEWLGYITYKVAGYV